MLLWLSLLLAVVGLLLIIFHRRRSNSPAPALDRRARQAGWAALSLGLAALLTACFRRARGQKGRAPHQPADTQDLFR